LNPKGHEP